MDCFAGLDLSIDETAICVVNQAGNTLMTASVATDPGAIAEALEPYRLCRAGHEAGALAPWLHPGLAEQGVPIVWLETFHVRAAMSAKRNKTMPPTRWGSRTSCAPAGSAAHIKTEARYRMRQVLIQRRDLKRKADNTAADFAGSVRRSHGEGLREKTRVH